METDVFNFATCSCMCASGGGSHSQSYIRATTYYSTERLLVFWGCFLLHLALLHIFYTILH